MIDLLGLSQEEAKHVHQPMKMNGSEAECNPEAAWEKVGEAQVLSVFSSDIELQLRDDANMTKEERDFWRMERYAKRWPPPWLEDMEDQQNAVVFLDVAIRSLDRQQRMHAFREISLATTDSRR